MNKFIRMAFMAFGLRGTVTMDIVTRTLLLLLSTHSAELTVVPLLAATTDSIVALLCAITLTFQIVFGMLNTPDHNDK